MRPQLEQSRPLVGKLQLPLNDRKWLVSRLAAFMSLRPNAAANGQGVVQMTLTVIGFARAVQNQPRQIPPYATPRHIRIGAMRNRIYLTT